MSRFRTSALPAALLTVLAMGMACAAPDDSGDPAAESADAGTGTAAASPSPIAELLADGQAVFGTFPGPSTFEQGALMGQNRELDFVFYSLESGPFDIMTTKVYMEGIVEGSGEEEPHPLILRIPTDPQWCRRSGGSRGRGAYGRSGGNRLPARGVGRGRGGGGVGDGR